MLGDYYKIIDGRKIKVVQIAGTPREFRKPVRTSLTYAEKRLQELLKEGLCLK